MMIENQNLKTMRLFIWLGLGIISLVAACASPQPTKAPSAPTSLSYAPYGDSEQVGSIEFQDVKECSGMDASPTQADLLWVINDSGNAPCVFAMGTDGRHRGQVLLPNVVNRDWESLDAFLWQNESYVLIADFGDNKQQYASHRLYVIREPQIESDSKNQVITAEIVWQIEFTYPDGGHDAEAVAVDLATGLALILSKRDSPPIVFGVPLFPSRDGSPVEAKKVAVVAHIPPPTANDLSKPYGNMSARPTGMDISADGKRIVVLTYKHAYLFCRNQNDTWADAFTRMPQQIALPSPYEYSNLRQRESICFSADDQQIFVTSEGVGAGIYRLNKKGRLHKKGAP